MLSVPLTRLPNGALQLHATTISFQDKALVIAGPSGTGKSSLALRMIALGACLVSDDMTLISTSPSGILAHGPDAAPQVIEVRGLGLLNAPVVAAERLHTILDLGTAEKARLPEPRTLTLFDQAIPVLHSPATPLIAEAMIHYLKYGRSE